jgi:tetratricopeptide (TPR) repeat protein
MRTPAFRRFLPSADVSGRRPRLPFIYPLLLLLVFLPACSGGGIDDDAVRRGDLAFAQHRWEEALAEYRLAVRQGADDAATLARVGQTYAMLGRVDDAGSYFRDAARLEPGLTDQAVAELMRLARDARASNDRFAMATAVETALELRPGVGVGEMGLDLARHYFRAGEYGRALPFYQKAMAEATDSTPEIVFEVGQAYEEIGDCRRALVFFERFREMVRAWERGEVDWYIGNCAFTLAGEVRRDAEVGLTEDARDEELGRALSLVERTIEVGEPRNLQGQAWFAKGEILSDLKRCEEAMEAYARVREVEGSGPLVERAQERYDEIRFGRGLEDLRGGRCR